MPLTRLAGPSYHASMLSICKIKVAYAPPPPRQDLSFWLSEGHGKSFTGNPMCGFTQRRCLVTGVVRSSRFSVQNGVRRRISAAVAHLLEIVDLHGYKLAGIDFLRC